MVRVVTINIWQQQGPHRRRIELLCRRLRRLNPDAVVMQEVREVPDSLDNQAHTVARALGMHWTYAPSCHWGGGSEGVAVLSRWPLERRRVGGLPCWEGRTPRVCLGARVVTDEGPLWLFTTHLAYRLGDGLLREEQVVAVDELVRGRDEDEAAVLAGDFNSRPDADEMRYLRGLTTLSGRRTVYQDAFALHNPGAAGHTWSADNPYTEPLAWLELNRRLDYIYVSPRRSDGRAVVEACRVVLRRPDAVGTRCSDHYGVMADIRVGAGASGR